MEGKYYLYESQSELFCDDKGANLVLKSRK